MLNVKTSACYTKMIYKLYDIGSLTMLNLTVHIHILALKHRDKNGNHLLM